MRLREKLNHLRDGFYWMSNQEKSRVQLLRFSGAAAILSASIVLLVSCILASGFAVS
jgi:hypothetical protein